MTGHEPHVHTSHPARDGQAQPALGVEDPVCGMTVTIDDDTAHLVHDGVTHWFCNPGCRQRYADELGAA